MKRILSLILCCTILFFFSCDKDPDAGTYLIKDDGSFGDANPTVNTSNVTNITQTSAKCGGVVTESGASEVTARGVCWSRNTTEPTVSDSHTTDGSGNGSFTSSITGLNSNTTYYVRAYATNGTGTSYGEAKNFTTDSPPPVTVPVVHTSNVTGVGLYSATCGGTVTDDGGAPVTARGVCWCRQGGLPTISDSHTTDGAGLGNFTSSITGLYTITTYYVRAYATNSAGTAYGETRSFMTSH